MKRTSESFTQRNFSSATRQSDAFQIRALFHRSRKIKIGKSLREKVPKFSPNKLVSISAFGQCPQSALLVIIT